MWLAVGLIVMVGSLIVMLILLKNRITFTKVIYTSALFLPLLVISGTIYAILFQGGNFNAPIFGISPSTITKLGLFQGDIMTGLQAAPWYGIVIFMLGAIIFFWCIASMLISLLLILSGTPEKLIELVTPVYSKEEDKS